MPSLEIWLKNFQKKRAAAFLLAPLSWGFLAGMRLRHRLYDKKWLKQKISSSCVVSVGNLVAGGVGKTQVVDLIASKLVENLRVAILSRGYRSQGEKQKKPLLVDPHKMVPELCGDEPWLLASRLKEAKVIVCKDRFLAAKLGEKLEKQVLILDDGMQHRRLFRDFEIVVVDGKDPFGRGKYLPWGMLRESPDRLKSADLVMSIGKLSSEDRQKLDELTDAPLVEAKIKVNGVHSLNGETIDSLEGKNVAVFCAIGNPERFVHTVKNLGANVVASRFFPDHGKIHAKDLVSFARFSKTQGAALLLCTEKDKVKISKNEETGACPIGWVSVRLEIEENNAAFEHAMDKIKQLAGAI